MRDFLLSYFTARGWTTLGLVMTMIGVLLLFRFGMPFRLSSSGGDYIVTESSSDPWWLDWLYWALGIIGLCAVLLGTLFQVAGTWL